MIQRIENAEYEVTTDWESETISKTNLKRGFYLIDNDDLEIKAGSVIDVNGVLYRFSTDESIANPVAANVYYMYLDTGTLELTYSATVPTFDLNKDGYYNGSTKRALLRLYWDGSIASDIQRLNKDFTAGALSVLGTANFRGTILDKNGNEVLAMKCEMKTLTTDFGPGASKYNVTYTHTYDTAVQGVVELHFGQYKTAGTGAPRWEVSGRLLTWTIGGTGNKTLTIVAEHSLDNTSGEATGYCYVTVLID